MTADEWPYHVELRIDPATATERVARIRSWLVDWQIPHRLCSDLSGTSTLRVAFAHKALARAFQRHFGGVMIAETEINAAMIADDQDEDLFERLAQDYLE